MNATVSIVLPVRIESEERLENVKVVLSWIDKIGCPIILLEADQMPRLKVVISPLKHVVYHFVKDNNIVFHRTKYINLLLHMSKSDTVVVWDADIILPYLQLKQAIDLRVQNHATIVYPYNGKVFMLSPKQSSTFRKYQDLLTIQNENLNTLMGRTACGGAYIVDRKKYLLSGGDNEKFVGWGPEDAERLHRVQIAGGRVLWTPSGPLYHLHHGRNEKKNTNFQANLLAMRKEFIKVCSFNKSEMLDYICKEFHPTKTVQS